MFSKKSKKILQYLWAGLAILLIVSMVLAYSVSGLY